MTLIYIMYDNMPFNAVAFETLGEAYQHLREEFHQHDGDAYEYIVLPVPAVGGAAAYEHYYTSGSEEESAAQESAIYDRIQELCTA